MYWTKSEPFSEKIPTRISDCRRPQGGGKTFADAKAHHPPTALLRRAGRRAKIHFPQTPFSFCPPARALNFSLCEILAG